MRKSCLVISLVQFLPGMSFSLPLLLVWRWRSCCWSSLYDRGHYLPRRERSVPFYLSYYSSVMLTPNDLNRCTSKSLAMVRPPFHNSPGLESAKRNLYESLAPPPHPAERHNLVLCSKCLPPRNGPHPFICIARCSRSGWVYLRDASERGRCDAFFRQTQRLANRDQRGQFPFAGKINGFGVLSGAVEEDGVAILPGEQGRFVVFTFYFLLARGRFLS